MEGGLRLRLLGSVQVERAGESVCGFESRKALALLCYLAVHDQPVSRSYLADLFWGDKPEARGRGNLSRVLHNLSTLLAGCLQADRHTIQFRCPATLWLDVNAFDQLVARGDTDSLTAAVALYRDDFMAGFYLDGCPEFDSWLVMERERWHRRVVEILSELIDYHTYRGEYKQGLGFVFRILELDPWREEAHRRMMLLLARTGQRSAALVQYETCRHILAEELDVEPAEETTALYERIRALGTVCCHNLLPQATVFIGREEELAKIARLLVNPACRLLTLVGPGGVGKTRLALQAALNQAKTRAFLEGIYFVSLAPVSSADFLVSAIADVLQCSFQGPAEPKTQLLNHLRGKEFLLVLDSFEHLLAPPVSALKERRKGGAELLPEILQSAPASKLMVTSRQRLNLQGEWLLEIQGLKFPTGRHDSVAGRIEDYSAVQLFLERARCYMADFAGSKAEEASMVRICQLVEGMPLAIELAATWVRTFSCSEIVREIERSFEFLAAPMRDVPERHRSMQAVFNHSWRLLSDEERAVFRKVSVFRGGFRTEAAQQVAGASPPILSALIDKSFLHRNHLGRFETHVLLRQYAREKLGANLLEEERTQDRHCSYYAAFLQHQTGRLKRGQLQEALEEISAEIKNVRLSWQWAVWHGKVEEISQSSEGLWLFYESRGWFHEGEEAFRLAADQLVQIGRQTNEVGQDDEVLLLGRVQVALAWFYYRLGSYNKSKTLFQKGMARLRQAEEKTRQELGFALGELGLVAWHMGDYTLARENLKESEIILRETHNWFLGIVLLYSGLTAQALGERLEARKVFQESLEILKETNNRRSIGVLLICSGWNAGETGVYDQAEAWIREGLAICREVRDLFGIALGLTCLGNAAYLRADFGHAKQLQQESLDTFMEIGDRWGMAFALTGLGYATGALGEYEASGQYFRTALKMAMEIEALPEALKALTGLANLLTASEPREKEQQQAVELLTLALDHPASSQETKNRAGRLLAELEAKLPSQVITQAHLRWQTRDLEVIVAEILGDIAS